MLRRSANPAGNRAKRTKARASLGLIGRVVVALTALTIVGVLDFWLLEDRYTLFDALYMAVITLTTVGYEEVHPLSDAGRTFVMVYLVLGLGVFLFSAATLGELIVRNQFAFWVEKRRMDSAVKSLKDHYIICGNGRMGRTICDELADRGLPFVVIDNDDAALEPVRARNWPWIHGDATDDAVLEQAGIGRARGLTAVLGSETDNLFVVFSARLLSAKLRILARATEDRQIAKLRKAGADRVISPYTAGGVKMAQLLANPHVETFIEIVTGGGRELDLAEVQISKSSPYAGSSSTRPTSPGAAS